MPNRSISSLAKPPQQKISFIFRRYPHTIGIHPIRTSSSNSCKQARQHAGNLLPLLDQTLHPPSGLPSYCQVAAAAVRQPPQLCSSSSWVDLLQEHVQNSVPTFTASTIILTAMTQDHSCHHHPVVVRLPLRLPPTSTCCSAVMPPAATAVPVLLKEAQYLSGEKVVGVVVASPHKEVRTAKSMVNLSELFATFANDVICIVALGRKYGDGEVFTKVTEDLGKESDVLLSSFVEGKFMLDQVCEWDKWES